MKLIILDRDGVINHDSDQFIKSPEEWQPIDGSLDAIAFLTQAGYTIAVATNQSGIARGYFNVQTLNEKQAAKSAAYGSARTPPTANATAANPNPAWFWTS